MAVELWNGGGLYDLGFEFQKLSSINTKIQKIGKYFIKVFVYCVMGVSLLITPLGDKQMTKKTGYTVTPSASDWSMMLN